MGEDGYVCVADYGLAKLLEKAAVTRTYCGTPEYMAPEMIGESIYGFSVDHWAIGVLAFELLAGIGPFCAGNNSDTEYYITSYPIEDRLKLLKDAGTIISEEASDFITHLLQKDPKDRLGQHDSQCESLKAHPWFNDIDMDALYEKKLESPFLPKMKADVFDLTHFAEEFTKEMTKFTVLPKRAIQQIDESNEFETKQ